MPKGRNQHMQVPRLEPWEQESGTLWAHAFAHCFADPSSADARSAFARAQTDIRSTPDEKLALLNAIIHAIPHEQRMHWLPPPDRMKQLMARLFPHLLVQPNDKPYFENILGIAKK
jgi:hypothetical protein